MQQTTKISAMPKFKGILSKKVLSKLAMGKVSKSPGKQAQEPKGVHTSLKPLVKAPSKQKTDLNMKSHHSKTVESARKSPSTVKPSSSKEPNPVEAEYSKLMGVYNTVGYLLNAILGENANEDFSTFFESLEPINDISVFLQKYDNNYNIAVRHIKDLENTLISWELKVLTKYETAKLKLIDIRKVEVFCVFLKEQRESFVEFLTKTKAASAAENDLNAQREQDRLVKITTTLQINSEKRELSLNDALTEMRNQKIEAEKRVEFYNLYARCIRELMRINMSNRTKITIWHGGGKKSEMKKYRGMTSKRGKSTFREFKSQDSLDTIDTHPALKSKLRGSK